MKLIPRALELIQDLKLQPHPEGGFYREIYRSPMQVRAEGRADHSAVTSIYFLLASSMISRWHKVSSDEIWHWYEGEPLELLVCNPELSAVKIIYLGQVSADHRPVYVVPAGWWQAARPVGAYTLCGCSVAPGFEFADFAFLTDEPSAAAQMKALGAHWAQLL